MDYLEQIANFITTNTQGAAIGPSPQSRQPPGAGPSEPPQSLPMHPAKVLPQTAYLSIRTANILTIQKKIQELNSQLVSSGSKDVSLNPSELETVKALCIQLEQTPNLQESSLLEYGLPLVVKIATAWPTESRLPGLDLLRLLAAATPLTATSDYGDHNLISIVASSGVFEQPVNVNNAMLAV